MSGKNNWLSQEKLYNSYRAMKSRCYYKKNNRYKNYGARGIKVCDEWKNNYLSFKKWAYENGYNEDETKKYTLDRINVNDDYKPSNCRWVDYKTQANNKTNNRLIKYKGEKHTVAEWSEITGINVGVLLYRLNHNWDIERALTLEAINGRNQYI